jgi:hypothetical protein
MPSRGSRIFAFIATFAVLMSVVVLAGNANAQPASQEMVNHYWKGYDGNSTFYMIKNISSIPTPSLLDLSEYFASHINVSKSTEIVRSLGASGSISKTRISVALGDKGNNTPYALVNSYVNQYDIYIPIAFSEVYHFSDNATGIGGKDLAELQSSTTNLNLNLTVPNLSKYQEVFTNLNYHYNKILMGLNVTGRNSLDLADNGVGSAAFDLVSGATALALTAFGLGEIAAIVAINGIIFDGAQLIKNTGISGTSNPTIQGPGVVSDSVRVTNGTGPNSSITVTNGTPSEWWYYNNTISFGTIVETSIPFSDFGHHLNFTIRSGITGLTDGDVPLNYTYSAVPSSEIYGTLKYSDGTPYIGEVNITSGINDYHVFTNPYGQFRFFAKPNTEYNVSYVTASGLTMHVNDFKTTGPGQETQVSNPDIPGHGYSVKFHETGLNGNEWSVSIVTTYGQKLSLSAQPTSSNPHVYISNITFGGLKQGTYRYYVSNVPDYMLNESEGQSFTITDYNQTIEVPFEANYSANFYEHGLPKGQIWSVDLGGNTISSTGNITFKDLHKQYNYTIPNAVTGIGTYIPSSGSGTVSVTTPPNDINITFQSPANISFRETGLPEGTVWSVSMGGKTISSSSTEITFYETYPYSSSYSYKVKNVSTSAGTYVPTNLSGTAYTASAYQPVKFNAPAKVYFNEYGLSESGITWSLTFDGNTYKGSTDPSDIGPIYISYPYGAYSYSVSDNSQKYYPASSSGSVNVVSGTNNFDVDFEPASVVTFIEAGLPDPGSPDLQWSVDVSGGGDYYSQYSTGTSMTLYLHPSTSGTDYTYYVSEPSYENSQYYEITYTPSPSSGSFSEDPGHSNDFSISYSESSYYVGPPSSGGGGGCVNATTPVLLANGTYEQAQYVSPGTMVLTYNTTTHTYQDEAVQNAFRTTHYRQYTINGYLQVSAYQPILTNHGYVKAPNLTHRDRIYDALTGRYVPIRSITLSRGTFTMYDFNIPPDHDFVAWNTVVYDITVG